MLLIAETFEVKPHLSFEVEYKVKLFYVINLLCSAMLQVLGWEMKRRILGAFS